MLLTYRQVLDRTVITVADFTSQDVVSRFTLDSATEFLFGNDVRSLSAGLNYPPGQFSEDPSAQHPANVFANSFSASQETMANRVDYGPAWPMVEFWGDRIKNDMEVVKAFVDPIVQAALAKKRHGNKQEIYDDEEEVTLLEHLVKITDGK